VRRQPLRQLRLRGVQHRAGDPHHRRGLVGHAAQPARSGPAVRRAGGIRRVTIDPGLPRRRGVEVGRVQGVVHDDQRDLARDRVQLVDRRRHESQLQQRVPAVGQHPRGPGVGGERGPDALPHRVGALDRHRPDVDHPLTEQLRRLGGVAMGFDEARHGPPLAEIDPLGVRRRRHLVARSDRRDPAVLDQHRLRRGRGIGVLADAVEIGAHEASGEVARRRIRHRTPSSRQRGSPPRVLCTGFAVRATAPRPLTRRSRGAPLDPAELPSADSTVKPWRRYQIVT